MDDMDDPQILIGLVFENGQWITQARVRNDLGLIFGAAVDFSSLITFTSKKRTMTEALSETVKDLFTLSADGATPSDEGRSILEALDGRWGSPLV